MVFTFLGQRLKLRRGLDEGRKEMKRECLIGNEPCYAHSMLCPHTYLTSKDPCAVILSCPLFTAFGAVLQGSLFGLAGMLPAAYTTPIMSGQGLAGTFAAFSMICALACKCHPLHVMQHQIRRWRLFKYKVTAHHDFKQAWLDFKKKKKMYYSNCQLSDTNN